MHFLCYINSKKDHKVDWNHDTEAKLGNLKNLLPYCQLGFSLKIGIPRLGSEPSQLGSAPTGKFQLGLITTPCPFSSYGPAGIARLPMLKTEKIRPWVMMFSSSSFYCNIIIIEHTVLLKIAILWGKLQSSLKFIYSEKATKFCEIFT